jgi:fluoroquinolone resistance protein
VSDIENIRANHDFESEVFTRVDFGNQGMVGKNFIDCEFNILNLANAKVSECNFTRCTFVSSDLSMCGFDRCSMSNVSLVDCKVLGVNWAMAGLGIDVDFLRCAISYSSFSEMTLRRKRFVECSAREVNFSHTDLRNAVFDRCDLAGSGFTGADLRGANFGTSERVFFEPKNVKLKNTVVSLDYAVTQAERLGFKVLGFTR